jgi:hypothetical protein
VAARAGVFAPGAVDDVDRSDLLTTALEHLLLLSMLQHPSGAWSWGRYVAAYPAGNSDFADAYARYRALLVDESTFASITLEELLAALPAAAALRDRYISA